MKTFRDLRQMAAEREAAKFTEQGRDVVVVQRRDPSSPTTIHKIPSIFELIDLEQFEMDKREAPARGIQVERIPPPAPILDFSAWTYQPRCPRCNGRRVEVKGVAILGGMHTKSERVMIDKPNAKAVCLRPKLAPGKDDEGRPIRSRNCLWKGKAKELILPCLACDAKATGVVDGLCPACSPAPEPPAPAKAAGKGRGKGVKKKTGSRVAKGKG